LACEVELLCGSPFFDLSRSTESSLFQNFDLFAVGAAWPNEDFQDLKAFLDTSVASVQFINL